MDRSRRVVRASNEPRAAGRAINGNIVSPVAVIIAGHKPVIRPGTQARDPHLVVLTRLCDPPFTADIVAKITPTVTVKVGSDRRRARDVRPRRLNGPAAAAKDEPRSVRWPPNGY